MEAGAALLEARSTILAVDRGDAAVFWLASVCQSVCRASHWTARLFPLGEGHQTSFNSSTWVPRHARYTNGLVCPAGQQFVRFVSSVPQPGGRDGAGLRHSADRLLLHTVAPGRRSSH